MKNVIGHFIVFSLCIFLNSCHYSNYQDIINEDEEVIINEIKRYEEIVRTGEFDSIRLIFTDDIVFIRPNNKNIIGIDSLFELHYSNLPAFPGFWKSAEEIEGSGHIAYTFGYYGFSEGVPSGKYLEIREKQEDGSWPVSRLTWHEILQK